MTNESYQLHCNTGNITVARFSIILGDELICSSRGDATLTLHLPAELRVSITPTRLEYQRRDDDVPCCTLILLILCNLLAFRELLHYM